MRRILVLFAAAAIATPAAALSAPTPLPVLPSIAAQPEIGRYVKDMAVSGGRLYVGGGNYTANTGPIDVAYYDLATGATGVAATAPTEEVNTFRTFGGNLFAPWVDPTGWGGETNPPNGGMTTDVGGWHNEHTFPAGHVYDYTELGTSRFLCGAIAYGGAGVWESKDGGPWTLIREEHSAGGATGWERFYWCVTLGGKVYVQAKHNGGTAAAPSSALFPMYSYDGTRWRKVRASIDSVVEGHQIETFKGRAYYRGGVFTGSRVVRNDAPVRFARDWFNAGDYLYVVGGDGTIARTSTGNTWEPLGQVVLPDGVGAYSVAVTGGHVYVGTSSGAVYDVTL